MVNRNAKCCYYQYESPTNIFCEGVIENSKTVIVFKDEKEAKAFKHKYCNSLFGCEKCPIHKGLDTKYE